MPSRPVREIRETVTKKSMGRSDLPDTSDVRGGGQSGGFFQQFADFAAVSETFTMAQNLPVAVTFSSVLQKLFVLVEASPTVLVRFNAPFTDLTDVTTLTFANDGSHDLGIGMVLLASTIYVVFADATQLVITPVDFTAMTAGADIVADGTKHAGVPAIATNGTSLFVSSTIDSVLWKYTTVGVLQATSPSTGSFAPSNVLVDGSSGAVYTVTGGPGGSEIQRYNATTLALQQSVAAPSGYGVGSNKQALLDSFLYVGHTGGAAKGNILRYEKLALTNAPSIIPIDPANAVGSLGVFLINSFIYSCQASGSAQIGRFAKIDPATLSVRSMVFGPGFETGSAAVGVNSNTIWVIFTKYPGKIVRLQY